MIGTIFLQIGGKFLKMVPFFGFLNFHTTRMVPFLLLNFGTFVNGTIFVCDFWYFSLMVLFLLPNFRKFLNWYFFVPGFSHFAKMVPYFGFQNFSHCTRMVPFLFYFFALCSNR